MFSFPLSKNPALLNKDPFLTAGFYAHISKLQKLALLINSTAANDKSHIGAPLEHRLIRKKNMGTKPLENHREKQIEVSGKTEKLLP